MTMAERRWREVLEARLVYELIERGHERAVILRQPLSMREDRIVRAIPINNEGQPERHFKPHEKTHFRFFDFGPREGK